MSTDWLFWGPALFAALCGAALLLWALFSDRSRGRKRCPKYWYDMDRSPTLRCSECGHEVRRERKLFRTRRRWRGVVVSALLLLLATGLAIQPKVQRDGWVSVLPLTVVACGLYLYENEWAKDELRRRYHPAGSIRSALSVDEPAAESSGMFSVGYRVLARAAWQVATDDATPGMEQREFFGFVVYAAQRARGSGEMGWLTRELRELACGDDRWSAKGQLMLSRVLAPEAAVEAMVHLVDEGCLAPQEAVLLLGRSFSKTDLDFPYIIRRSDFRPRGLVSVSIHNGTSADPIEAAEAILNRLHATGDSSEDLNWALCIRLALEPAASRHKVLRRFVQDGNDSARVALAQCPEWRSLCTPAMTPEVLSWLWEESQRVRKAAVRVFIALPTADLVGLEAELDALTAHEDVSIAAVARNRRSELRAHLAED